MKKTSKNTTKISKSNKSSIIDQIKIIEELFSDKIKQVIKYMDLKFEKIDEHFSKVENRLDKVKDKLDKVEDKLNNVEIELSQVKTAVLDIQNEKVSRSEFLSLEKRVTKLEWAKKEK